MAMSFNTQGATPQNYGSMTYNPVNPNASSPAANALNTAQGQPSVLGSIGNWLGNAYNKGSSILNQGVSNAQQNIGMTPTQPSPPQIGVSSMATLNSAGLIPKSSTITDASGNSHSMTYDTSGNSNSNSGGSSSSTGNAQNIPVTNPNTGQTSYVSGTAEALPGAIASAGGQSQSTTQNNPIPVSTPSPTSYGGLITQAANSATNSPFVTQEQNILGKEQALAGQLAPALSTVTNTPGLLANQNARAANVTNAYGAEMQGLGSTLQGATSAQGTQQSGLLGAGTLASPANANVTAPAGGVTTNTLTGQQYSNPIYGAPGMLQPYSPQPAGTIGQPATAGQAQPYTVKQGDTLNAIAAANNTTVAALQAANPSITDPNQITTGQQITIPSSTGTNAYIGGVMQGENAAGQNIVAMGQGLAKAESFKTGLQQFLSDPANSGINFSNIAPLNAIQQWVQNGVIPQGNYQTFFNYLNEYTNALAPVLGVGGDSTNLKTTIAQSFVNPQANPATIMQVINNMDTQAQTALSQMAAAGQNPQGSINPPAGNMSAPASGNAFGSFF